MYLASPSINYLHVFLNGYFLGQGKENSSEGLNELMLFQDWLARQKSITTNQNWAQIVLFCSCNEYEAFKNFFSLYSLFKHSQRRAE